MRTVITTPQKEPVGRAIGALRWSLSVVSGLVLPAVVFPSIVLWFALSLLLLVWWVIDAVDREVE